MSYVDDRETFFTPHAPDKDTAMPHGMTAQYLNECVLKCNGMEVVDNDGDIWGWVYDCHKGVGRWIAADTHDKRVRYMSDGIGRPALLPDYEPYRYATGNENFPDDPTGYDAQEWATPEPSPPGKAWCKDCGQYELIEEGFTVERTDYDCPRTDHMHVPINDPVKPYIIAVEGIDGAGKNTYTQKLAALLNAQVVSFPQYGITSAAELIEGGLRDAEKYSPWHMAQLFAADRKESAGLLTCPGVIIVDRYVASNAAYLHAKTGYHDAFDAMETLEYDTLGLPKPDLQIFVDTPVEVAMGRTQSRAESTGGEPDVNETDQGLQERVRESYLQMVESQWVSPWIVIDGQAQK